MIAIGARKIMNIAAVILDTSESMERLYMNANNAELHSSYIYGTRLAGELTIIMKHDEYIARVLFFSSVLWYNSFTPKQVQ